jgi:hypothetical protein
VTALAIGRARFDQTICRKLAVDHIDISAPKAKFSFGPNGSGKTTTIRMPCGFSPMPEKAPARHQLLGESDSIKRGRLHDSKASYWEDLYPENLNLWRGFTRSPTAVAKSTRRLAP